MALKVGQVYRQLYGLLCGTHPETRPWHYQWLPGPYVVGDRLRREIAPLGGRVLDVGCGEKPYEAWMPHAEEYYGIDVGDGPEVDMVIRAGEPWDLPDDHFDVVLCTQVLYHVADPELTLSEIARVLKPGGRLIVTVLFIYNEVGTPHDYRRFTRFGIRDALSDRHDVLDLVPLGAAGSSLGLLFLNWIDASMNRRGELVLVLMLLLPLWLLLCAAVNALAVLVDRLDRTGFFYNNVLVVARKRPAEATA